MIWSGTKERSAGRFGGPERSPRCRAGFRTGRERECPPPTPRWRPTRPPWADRARRAGWAAGERRGAEVEVALRHTRRTMELPARTAVGGPRRNRRGREEAGGKLECGARMMLVPCGGTGSEALNVKRSSPPRKGGIPSHDLIADGGTKETRGGARGSSGSHRSSSGPASGLRRVLLRWA